MRFRVHAYAKNARNSLKWLEAHAALRSKALGRVIRLASCPWHVRLKHVLAVGATERPYVLRLHPALREPFSSEIGDLLQEVFILPL